MIADAPNDFKAVRRPRSAKKHSDTFCRRCKNAAIIV